MRYTVADCVNKINQILNYPSIAYDDVSAFFDQAIAELNTSLHIALPLVSEIVTKYYDDASMCAPLILIGNDYVSEFPHEATEGIKYYYNADNNNIRYSSDGEWFPTTKLYAVRNGTNEYYVSVILNTVDGAAVWTPFVKNKSNVDLTDYLPTDWIILFLIPYVCFKYAVRNGDDGSLYSDEFSQGFQQLSTSYSVPHTVRLRDVAGSEAYKDQVLESLECLDKAIVTRAITEDMLVNTHTSATFGDVYDNGGWL